MSTVPDEAPADVETHRKPPFLRRVRIRNFKSIKFCDVTLEPLTVLVGRNGSGKSNFVEALAFLRGVIEGGASEAVRAHGGRSRVLARDAGQETLSIEADFATRSDDNSIWNALYRIELIVREQHAPRFAVESLHLTNSRQSGQWGFERTGDRWVQRSTGKESEGRAVGTDRPILSLALHQPAFELTQHTSNIGTYNFRPDLIRQPQPSNPEFMLHATGRNLASVLGSIEALQLASLETIRQYFAIITGGIELEGVVDLGQYETVGFRVPCSDKSRGTQFDAASMSDGTLRVLAALTAAFQPGWPFDAPSLVAIEEPETSLHPAAMHALVDALAEATGRTQILLTTHSAELLDNPTIRPENVRVVEMVDGETIITLVDEASAEIVWQQLDTLGGLERQAQLSRHLDDEDRQRKLAAESRPQ